MHLKKSLVLTLSASILFFLSSPGFLTPFFLFIFLVPSFFVYQRVSLKKAFLFALLQWTVAYGVANYWFVYSAVSIYKLSIVFSIVLYLIIIVLFFALYQSLFSLCFSYVIKKKKRGAGGYLILLVTVPLVWSLMEYIRGMYIPMLNVTSITSFFYTVPLLIQLIDILGEHLFGAVIIAGNILLYLLCEFLLRRSLFTKSFAVKCMAIITILAAVPGYGIISYYTYHGKDSNKQSLRSRGTVLLVQLNIAGEKKWKKQYYGEILDEYIRATKKNLTEKTKIVLWPETAVNFYPQLPGAYTKKLNEFAQNQGITILTGAPEFFRSKKGANERNYYNALFKAADGSVESIYRKEGLLPFAEYCPVDFLYPLFKKVIGENQYTPYKKNINNSDNGLFYGMAICFESTFPHIIKERAAGSDVVFIFSDNVWLGDTTGPLQNLAACVLRAIENRVWIIAVVNCGYSAIISPYGDIVDILPYNSRGTLTF
ncbi:MAG: apolipoprotein N-acyltransferase [bacterium]|nr:apolipoprotein N-acyltransferase [bacterium]